MKLPEVMPMKVNPNAPRTKRKPASPRLSRVTEERRSPDVIWPESGVAEALELLRRWREEEDAGEQRTTGAMLLRALDEDRLSYRKFSP